MATLSPPLVLLNAIGFVGGLLAGLVGVGGAIVLTPLLLYTPPLFRLAPLGMHAVSGITMVQVAVAGTFAAMVYRRDGHIDAHLVKSLGTAVIAGSFLGAALSGYVPGEWLEGLFACLALLTVVLVPLRQWQETGTAPVSSRLSTGFVAAIGLPLGFVVGMVGAGGGFLLVPVMLYLLGVPPRTAIGTSLAIVALSAVAGTIGKTIAGQVDGVLALALLAGGVPGTQVGAALSSRLSPRALMLLFAAFIGMAASRMWWELLR